MLYQQNQVCKWGCLQIRSIIFSYNNFYCRIVSVYLFIYFKVMQASICVRFSPAGVPFSLSFPRSLRRLLFHKPHGLPWVPDPSLFWRHNRRVGSCLFPTEWRDPFWRPRILDPRGHPIQLEKRWHLSVVDLIPGTESPLPRTFDALSHHAFLKYSSLGEMLLTVRAGNVDLWNAIALQGIISRSNCFILLIYRTTTLWGRLSFEMKSGPRLPSCC